MKIDPIILLAIFPIWKLFTNLYWLHRVQSLEDLYKKYVEALKAQKTPSRRGSTKEVKNEFGTELIEKSHEIRELFHRANIKDRVHTQMEPIGVNKSIRQEYSFYDNMENDWDEVIDWVLHSFTLSSGHFKRQTWNSVSPIYWTELLMKAPGSTLIKLGVDKNTIWPKVTNSVVALVIVLAIIWTAITGKPFSLTLEDGSKKVSVEVNQNRPASEIIPQK